MFASDSRTNAGADHVSTFSKMHTFDEPGDRAICLLSAGNLATTQAVLRHIRRDNERGSGLCLNTARDLAEAAEDAAAFEQRAQYAGYRVIDDIFINADLTSGEDIADLGGLVLAWHAWRKETENVRLSPLDGLEPDQRFFVGFAQWACSAERPESLRLHAATDPHSPPRYRINGVVVNMPEFKAAFDCPDGAAMVKPIEEVCRIW